MGWLGVIGLGAKVTGRLIVVGSFTRAGYGEVGGVSTPVWLGVTVWGLEGQCLDPGLVGGEKGLIADG